jgi:hypothetical protein
MSEIVDDVGSDTYFISGSSPPEISPGTMNQTFQDY